MKRLTILLTESHAKQERFTVPKHVREDAVAATSSAEKDIQKQHRMLNLRRSITLTRYMRVMLR